MPNYYGFNFQWMFSKWDAQPPQAADPRALDFLAKHGFNFVRIPTDYRFWTEGTDYFHPNESVLNLIDSYLEATRRRGLYLSLNLHRAPGYCINGNDLETHNLWTDAVAQDAFVFLWRAFAERYRGVPPEELSFDLLNEPPAIGQYGCTREIHERLMRSTAAAIRAIDADRPIVVDGLGGGNLAMPELADLGAIHSGRGYQPMAVSHYEAQWWSDHRGLPFPQYPGTIWEGRVWDREGLVEFYEPWRKVERLGARVHIGEFGCYNHTPNDVALRWLSDLMSVFRELRWGYALWNFEGPFGIIGHGRPGARIENVDGFEVDRDLLEVFLANRVT